MQQCENVTMLKCKNAKSENATMRKCNYEKKRKCEEMSLCVFAFLYFDRYDRWKRIYDIFYPSYFRSPSVVFSLFVTLKMRKCETLSSLRVFAF
jgi:hypothetical protein